MTDLPSLPPYCELHCLSNFTFLRGASHAEELVARAKALGYSALAITDECSAAGVVRAHQAAKQHGLKLIVGTEIQIEDGPRLVLLAANREGYGHIASLITRARSRAAKGRYCALMADLERNLDHCLVLMLPDSQPRPHSPTLLHSKCALALEREGVKQHALALARRFPQRAWIAVELHKGANDAAHLDALRELSAYSALPLVAAEIGRAHV